jgi:hypothetical protein
VSFINQYDIIGIQESKLDDVDNIHIDGYTIYMHNREHISRYRSGGITLIVKDNLKSAVTVLENSNTLTLWFKLKILNPKPDPNLSNTFLSVNCGIVYIPPIRSKYAHTDPYLELQNDIDKIGNEPLLLFGDFNSRTGDKTDFVLCDDFLLEHFGCDELLTESSSIINSLTEANIPLIRKTSDMTTNEYGNMLLDFCKSNNLFILNGRIGNDHCYPKTTCKGASTIDYFISSTHVAKYIQNLEVLEFSNLLSDAHSAVTININAKCHYIKTKKHEEQIKTPFVKLWDNDTTKINAFTIGLNHEKINNILTELQIMTERETNSQENIDNITQQIETIFLENCQNSFGKKEPIKKKRENKTNNFKKWFDGKCHRARNKYHNARKIYNKYKTENNKQLLKEISKEYKQTLNTTFNKYRSNNVQKLRTMKTSNPKEYWKAINKLNNKSNNDDEAKLNDFYIFFKNINSNEENSDDITQELDLTEINRINEEINSEITQDEIIKTIRTLKNGKSPGNDHILNEHIKSTAQIMVPIYTKLFNIIFNQGIIPEKWTEGNILPIYKNKGNTSLPENYRPITLLSCLGKLFTAILNNRLTKYTEENLIIKNCQAGFRKEHSTIDNLFVIQSLLDIFSSQKKKLYCAFIDFKQAFDTVWRSGLWSKLLKYNINGKCLNIIKNLYSNIKSRIQTKEGSSPFFPCLNGVRQGENLSPLLFSIYLNDLEHFLSEKTANGVICDIEHENIGLYFKLFVILYADDTVLIGNNSEDLQQNLNYFEEYCDKWKLTVNVSKTKIMIFGLRNHHNQQFTFKNQILEIVKEYKYLGLFLSNTKSYVIAKKHIADQANKAMFSLLRKIRDLNLQYDLQIDLFNKTVKPILLYGCELWGYSNLDIIERIQLKFLKLIFKLKRSTPSHMIYAETGVKPLKIEIQGRMISYWTKLCDPTSEKLSNCMYIIIHGLQEQRKLKSKWLSYIKNSISQIGFGYIWENQKIFNRKWFPLAFKQSINDQYLQNWNQISYTSTSSTNYRIFKTEFKQNKYYTLLPNYYARIFTAFRTRNHHLPIEIGRWNSTPLNERHCSHCTNTEIADEFHYLFNCIHFQEQRKQLIRNYYYINPNTLKFYQLFNSENKTQLVKLCKFIDIIMKTVRS